MFSVKDPMNNQWECKENEFLKRNLILMFHMAHCKRLLRVEHICGLWCEVMVSISLCLTKLLFITSYRYYWLFKNEFNFVTAALIKTLGFSHVLGKWEDTKKESYNENKLGREGIGGIKIKVSKSLLTIPSTLCVRQRRWL